MAETPPYCSGCYNVHARANDAQVKAAEGAVKIPMARQGPAPSAARRRSWSIMKHDRGGTR